MSAQALLAHALQSQILARRDMIVRCRGLLPLAQCEAIVAAVLDQASAIAGVANEKLSGTPAVILEPEDRPHG